MQGQAGLVKGLQTVEPFGATQRPYPPPQKQDHPCFKPITMPLFFSLTGRGRATREMLLG